MCVRRRPWNTRAQDAVPGASEAQSMFSSKSRRSPPCCPWLPDPQLLVKLQGLWPFVPAAPGHSLSHYAPTGQVSTAQDDGDHSRVWGKVVCPAPNLLLDLSPTLTLLPTPVSLWLHSLQVCGPPFLWPLLYLGQLIGDLCKTSLLPSEWGRPPSSPKLPLVSRRRE